MHIDEWLAGLAKEEQEKQAAAELEGLIDHMSVEDVLQIAGSDQEQEKTARTKREYDEPYDVKIGWRQTNKMERRMQPGAAVLGSDRQYLKHRGLKRSRIPFKKSKMTRSAAKEYMRPDERRKYLGSEEGKKKVAFVEKIARQIAREHVEVEKQAVIGGALLGGGAGALYGKAKDKKVGKSAAKGALIGGAAEGAGYLGALAGRALTAGERASLQGGAGLAGGIGGALLGGLAMRRAVKDKKKDKEMTKEDAFTTPEAKAKAKVMSRAMKATKGAPPNVMRSAIKMTAKQVRAVDR